MKAVLVLLFIFLQFSSYTQKAALPREPFHQLDSISKTSSISKHFGELYYIFLCSIEEQLADEDTAAQRLIRRFENVFAGFYINACTATLTQEKFSLHEWEAYFTDTSLQLIQYWLLGANAHLNGGLWNALVNSFTMEELDGLKKQFKIFKRSLNTTFKLVYLTAVKTNARIALLDNISFGMDRWLGNYYLYKWRKRQMRLAYYYYTKSPKFTPLLKKVNAKKNKIDKLIVTAL